MKNIFIILLILLLSYYNGFSQDGSINSKNRQQIWVKDSTFFYNYNNDNWELNEINKVLNRNIYGKKTSSISYIYNYGTLNWENREQTNITYNNSNIEKLVSKAWNSNFDNWEDTILYREYDTENNIVKYFLRNYDYDLNAFTGGYKLFNTYDNNLKIEQIDYLWNKLDVGWKLFGKKEYIYSNIILKSVTNYNWSSNNDWKKTSIKTDTSTWMGDIIFFKTWNEDGLNWGDSIGYEYYSVGAIFSEEFEDFSKRTIFFDSNNNITKELFQVATDQYAELVNVHQTVYSYNENDNLTEKLFQAWDTNSVSWKNISKEMYYWSEFELVGLDNIYANEITIFPNPVTERINFERNGINLNNKSFHIFSTTGKLIKSGLIFKNEVNVSDLSIGSYILSIKVDNKFFVKKIIKK